MISTLKYFSIFLFLLLVNCTSRPDQASEVALPKTDSSQDLSLNLMDEKMLQEFISSRNGKYLFLNVWATWCIPCREEFPDLIKLAELYKTKGVEFAGLSVDYPDEFESKILPFLEKNPVNFPIYVQNFEDKENAINLLIKNGAVRFRPLSSMVLMAVNSTSCWVSILSKNFSRFSSL